jgi:hypothetical protein
MPIFAPMTGDELQRARRAAAERYTAIAMLYVPEGVTIEYRKSLSGYATKNKIMVPSPVTRKALYIFLHECAHVHLGHVAQGDRTPIDSRSPQSAASKSHQCCHVVR